MFPGARRLQFFNGRRRSIAGQLTVGRMVSQGNPARASAEIRTPPEPTHLAGVGTIDVEVHMGLRRRGGLNLERERNETEAFELPSRPSTFLTRLLTQP